MLKELLECYGIWRPLGYYCSRHVEYTARLLQHNCCGFNIFSQLFLTPSICICTLVRLKWRSSRCGLSTRRLSNGSCLLTGGSAFFSRMLEVGRDTFDSMESMIARGLTPWSIWLLIECLRSLIIECLLDSIPLLHRVHYCNTFCGWAFLLGWFSIIRYIQESRVSTRTPRGYSLCLTPTLAFLSSYQLFDHDFMVLLSQGFSPNSVRTDVSIVPHWA